MLLILEVLDKTWSPEAQWGFGIIGGVCGYFACRRYPPVLILILAIAAGWAWSMYSMYQEPYIGPAMRQEGGWVYPLHVIGSICALLLPSLVGAVRGYRQHDSTIASRGAV